MLDFSADMVLPNGERLTESELKNLLDSRPGFIQVKGQWVAVDPEKLNAVLAHWKKLERQTQREGLSWAEGIRWLAGAQSSSMNGESAALTEYSRVIEGEWLHAALAICASRKTAIELYRLFCSRVFKRSAPVSTDGSAMVMAIISVTFRRLSGRRHGTGKNSAGIGVIAAQ